MNPDLDPQSWQRIAPEDLDHAQLVAERELVHDLFCMVEDEPDLEVRRMMSATLHRVAAQAVSQLRSTFQRARDSIAVKH